MLAGHRWASAPLDDALTAPLPPRRCSALSRYRFGHDDAADRAAETARATFEQGAIASSLPTIEVPRADLKAGLGVLNASLLAGFVQSTGEARRQIKGGGLKINDEPVSDDRRMLTSDDLTQEGVIKLSLGKKRHVLIRPV